jgi:voltage-gated sodium channel
MMKLFFNNRFILSLILLNSIVIFIGGFNIYPLFVNVIDNVITTLFIIELVVKLKEYGKNYFKQGWNVFDFILIILSLPTFISFVFGFEVHDLSFLLAFRVMRIFKSFRFLKFIPNIDTLILGIVRALKSSLVVLFGFIVYIFIVGVLSFYLFGTTSPEYFGNPLIS